MIIRNFVIEGVVWGDCKPLLYYKLPYMISHQSILQGCRNGGCQFLVDHLILFQPREGRLCPPITNCFHPHFFYLPASLHLMTVTWGMDIRVHVPDRVVAVVVFARENFRMLRSIRLWSFLGNIRLKVDAFLRKPARHSHCEWFCHISFRDRK